jgi:hypothetical protein
MLKIVKASWLATTFQGDINALLTMPAFTSACISPLL